jgi:hypothetical protein
MLHNICERRFAKPLVFLAEEESIRSRVRFGFHLLVVLSRRLIRKSNAVILQNRRNGPGGI